MLGTQGLTYLKAIQGVFMRYFTVSRFFKTMFVLMIICSLGLAAMTSAGAGRDYPISFLNDRARDITGATAVNVPGFVVPGGLTGQGQIVALADSGLDIGSMDDIHPDLKSTAGKMPKIVLLKSWADRPVPDDPDGHGTHMAATIAGTGAASQGKFRGMAPEASIYFQAILDSAGNPTPPANLADLFYPAYSAGARVHVNGWGGGPNAYLGSAAQVDDFARTHPDFLAIFGAGNGGPSANTITSEANSKNVLAVGASILPRPAFVPGEGDTTAPAHFSSCGPAGDGRIKPELLAPASAVISAKSRLVESNLPGYPDYTRLQGTSMAAAVGGGSATLVREYLKKHLDLATPSAALVKAVLINGARTGDGGPSQEGFGVIDLAGTIIALEENTFSLTDEWSGLAQGEEITYTYHISDSAAPFKATLTWADPPAEPGSAKTLVNDLDLVVQTPDGRIYHGNHFVGPNAPDRTNNVEQVYLPAPIPGDYTITVKGATISRNTVKGTCIPQQDFALVWGQPPAKDMVEKVNSSIVKLTSGDTFDFEQTPTVNLVNDNITTADAGHLFTGAAVQKTPQRIYLTARLWRSIGVRVIQTAEGSVFTEINPAARLGGYSPAANVEEVMLNNAPVNPTDIPPGVEISAVANPYDQQLRLVSAAYTERTGAVSAISEGKNGEKILHLAGGGSYRISPGAAYSYADSYANVDQEDTPFGTSALEQLEEILPGMPVLLRLAPSSGQVQYLAVKRTVALGTVCEVKYPEGEILFENGAGYKVLPGAPVKRDGRTGSLELVQPGDRLAAVILPDTGEAIGLVVFSSVIYGKAIDFSRQDRIIYFLDDDGVYRALNLADGAIIYRWGLRTTADAIGAGNRIRVTTDPEVKTVWQLDIAETAYEKGILKSVDKDAGMITTAEGNQYTISDASRFYKNNYPVPPDGLRPGEYMELEYAIAPPPTGNVLVSLHAESGVLPPALQAAVVPLADGLVVTGRTGANTAVYVWTGHAYRQAFTAESGEFNLRLEPADAESSLTLVALDRHTGGIIGDRVGPFKDGWDIQNEGLPVTRAEMAEMLSRLLNWTKCGDGSSLTFSDKDEIPVSYRPAVAEAGARGILKGDPDGRCRPLDNLSRVEVAAICANALDDLGLAVETNGPLPYLDADTIPHWAISALGIADAAGLFSDRRGGTFAGSEKITAEEITTIFKHLLDYCGKNL